MYFQGTQPLLTFGGRNFFMLSRPWDFFEAELKPTLLGDMPFARKMAQEAEKRQGRSSQPAWWFKVTFLWWLSDRFKGLSGLQLGMKRALWITWRWWQLKDFFIFIPKIGVLWIQFDLRIFFRWVETNQTTNSSTFFFKKQVFYEIHQ